LAESILPLDTPVESAALFESQGYVVVRQLIPPDVADFLRHFAEGRARLANQNGDGQVTGSPSIYADPLMDQLLDELAPVLGQVSGRQLLPTYSYFREYKAGAILKRHTDRPSCEISATLTLGYRGEIWPIFVEGPRGAFSAKLGVGDALLYKGIECPHWRDEFSGESLTQVFLHYVDANGPHSALRFDGRASLSRRLTSAPLLVSKNVG